MRIRKLSLILGYQVCNQCCIMHVPPAAEYRSCPSNPGSGFAAASDGSLLKCTLERHSNLKSFSTISAFQ